MHCLGVIFLVQRFNTLLGLWVSPQPELKAAKLCTRWQRRRPCPLSGWLSRLDLPANGLQTSRVQRAVSRRHPTIHLKMHVSALFGIQRYRPSRRSGSS